MLVNDFITLLAIAYIIVQQRGAWPRIGCECLWIACAASADSAVIDLNLVVWLIKLVRIFAYEFIKFWYLHSNSGRPNESDPRGSRRLFGHPFVVLVNLVIDEVPVAISAS